jgi:DUF1365 family protein
MVNRGDGERVFDAALTLERREISGASLAWTLARYPFATVNSVRRIYWQALRLWLRRIPFHAHPATRAEERRT